MEKFEIQMPAETDYMIIVNLDELIEKDGLEISEIDKDNSIKMLSLF